jgi:hypothetical protein
MCGRFALNHSPRQLRQYYQTINEVQFIVKNVAGKQRHFAVEDGRIVEHISYKIPVRRIGQVLNRALSMPNGRVRLTTPALPASERCSGVADRTQRVVFA